MVDSDWTVREVAAHLVLIAEAFCRYVSGDTTPVIDLANLATTNPLAIAAVEERDVSVLGTRLESAMARFVGLTESRDPGELMTWHGVDAPIEATSGIYLGELLMHGDDVARTLDRPWPIAPAEAIAVLEGTHAVSRLFLSPSGPKSTATFEVRLRDGPSLVFRFADGTLENEFGPAPEADCRVNADPVALLYVLYGRRSQWGAIVRGKMMAYGRRPWLAVGFNDRFTGF